MSLSRLSLYPLLGFVRWTAMVAVTLVLLAFTGNNRCTRGEVAISPDGRTIAAASTGPVICRPIGPFGLFGEAVHNSRVTSV